MLLEKGYKYISIPSAGSWEVIARQEAVPVDYSLGIDERHALHGSAESGILEYFMDKEVNEELLLFSMNECFRNEQNLEGMIRLREFKKLEQFCFCKEENADKYFNELLKNSTDFLERHKPLSFEIIGCSWSTGTRATATEGATTATATTTSL